MARHQHVEAGRSSREIGSRRWRGTLSAVHEAIGHSRMIADAYRYNPVEDPTTMAPAEARAPRFSVVMPAYDAEPTIAASIGSVQDQSLDDWELIVVDDGSSDGTWPIVESLAERDARIVALRQDNAGPAVARNRAAAVARGEVLAFLDSDDMMSPVYLARCADALASHPDVSVVGCNAWCHHADGSVTHPFRVPDGRDHEEVTLADHIASSALPGYSCVRRREFEGVGGYRAIGSEDYDLWLRLLRSGVRAIRLSEPLVHYDAARSGRLSLDRETVLGGVLDSIETLVAEAAGDPRVDGLVRARARQLRAEIALLPVKRAIDEGRYAGARRAFVANRFAMGMPRRWVVLALVLASPALYRAVVGRVDRGRV
jgi:GT2 family glycosyltransferase